MSEPIVETTKPTDTFGNVLPFVALKKEDKVPSDIIDGGPSINHPDNAEITLKLDILHVQRGDCKGQRYYGKAITKDNLDTVIEFFGAEYVASRLDTSFNTENQRYCLGQGGAKPIAPITPFEELLKSISTRTVRGESIVSMRDEQTRISGELLAEMQKMPMDMEKCKTLQNALIEISVKIAGKV